jgi:Nas2 N_terminal domain
MTTAADLKKQLAELSDQRSRLEADVSLARARLEATGLGMDEPLVDSEVRMVVSRREGDIVV